MKKMNGKKKVSTDIAKWNSKYPELLQCFVYSVELKKNDQLIHILVSNRDIKCEKKN